MITKPRSGSGEEEKRRDSCDPCTFYPYYALSPYHSVDTNQFQIISSIFCVFPQHKSMIFDIFCYKLILIDLNRWYGDDGWNG